MPGRTPAEAFDDFIRPIEAAVACLGIAKITVSPGARHNPSGEHSWTLNTGSGMAFDGSFLFHADMKFEYAPWEGGYRVHTLMYTYRLLCGGQELWVMHFHPGGRSDYERPHLHISSVADKAHLPSPRMTLEDAVEWVIACGVAPVREDWREILQAGKDVHIEHRTWQ